MYQSSELQCRVKSITVRDSNYFGWYNLCKWVSKNSRNIKVCISPQTVTYKLADELVYFPETDPDTEESLREKEQLLYRLERESSGDLGGFSKSLRQAHIVGVCDRIKLYCAGQILNEQVAPLPVPVVRWTVENFHSLKMLQLSSCAIQSEHLRLIGLGLPELRELNLRNNNLNGEYLRELFCRTPKLEILNIAKNPIGEEGVQLIFRNLKELERLRIDSGLRSQSYINLCIRLRKLTHLCLEPYKTQIDTLILTRLKKIFKQTQIQVGRPQYY